MENEVNNSRWTQGCLRVIAVVAVCNLALTSLWM